MLSLPNREPGHLSLTRTGSAQALDLYIFVCFSLSILQARLQPQLECDAARTALLSLFPDGRHVNCLPVHRFSTPE